MTDAGEIVFGWTNEQWRKLTNIGMDWEYTGNTIVNVAYGIKEKATT